MLVPSIFGESLLDDFFDYPEKSFSFRTSNANGLMKTDIKENEHGFEVSIALPGVKKDDIEIELKDEYLTISATSNMKNDKEDKKSNYIRRERYYGSCSRSFYVGDAVTENDIKASYEDGILTLDIPKVEKKPEPEVKKLIPIMG
jgi:HSP20 family molecular chaperone IbpA